MGIKTKIDWCDSTWSPVTGCLHNCEYCYARKIANRFSMQIRTWDDHLYICDEPVKRENGSICPYPFGFEPTFHRYKLDEPQRWKKPKNIFVCSMADLFGAWVPDEWIHQVMDACYAATQHTYLFLTKNPERYGNVIEYLETDVKESPGDTPPTMLLGASATTNEQLERAYETPATWISIEPILEPLNTDENFFESMHDGYGEREFARWKWVVIGAETGNRKNKVVPKKDWVMEIVKECEKWHTPVFMKESLREIMGDDFRQEFPWEV